MNTLPAVDVVIVGGGWSGLLMAKELGSRTPLKIVVLERGAARARGDYLTTMDELDYAVRLRMMQDASAETVTVRLTGKSAPCPAIGIISSRVRHWRRRRALERHNPSIPTRCAAGLQQHERKVRDWAASRRSPGL